MKLEHISLTLDDFLHLAKRVGVYGRHRRLRITGTMTVLFEPK